MYLDTGPDAFARAISADTDRRSLAMRALHDLNADAARYHAFIGMHGGEYADLGEQRMCEADQMRDAALESAALVVKALAAVNIHAGMIAEFLTDATGRGK